MCCILFHFYIKPQLVTLTYRDEDSCILFHFYIKPQHCYIDCKVQRGCILFHFYIKPQREWYVYKHQEVVSYSISTSNHNIEKRQLLDTYVVSYSISTSNHNLHGVILRNRKLYLIPFLHQTTTCICFGKTFPLLYLIPFLHQTTTYGA